MYINLKNTLSINIYQDPTKHVETFLQDWSTFGSYEHLSDLQYKLLGHSGKNSILDVTQYKITISGEIPSQSFMLIDKLSKACEADKVIEGEVIDKNQTNQRNFNNTFGNQPFGQSSGVEFQMPKGMNSLFKISGMSKFKLILLMILSLPLLIIMIPIMIIVMIFKIIMFKLNFK